MSTKFWCFTSYKTEYFEGGIEMECDFYITRIARTMKCFAYAISGLEQCPETKRWHLQGYIEFNRSVEMKSIKKWLGDESLHLEVREGTQEEAIKYCKKDDVIREWGTPLENQQGKRTDLTEIKNSVLKEGVEVRDLLENGKIQNYQQLKFAEALQKYKKPVKRTMPRNEWIFGATGTGKTRLAYETYPDAYWVEPDCEWYDGYCGEKTVIFDEFRGQIKLSKLLRILDRYPLKLKIKGGFIDFCPETIIITSCSHPEECYKNCDENIAQLTRRLSSIKFCEIGACTEVGGNTRAPTKI